MTLHAPVSFAHAGPLGAFTAEAAFPVRALLDAFGNMPGWLIQDGFTGLKPLQAITKLARLDERAAAPAFVEEFAALELWNRDNVPVAGAFYRTLIEDLYRGDRLARGTLELGGRPVRLGSIVCPTLVVSAEDDAICLPAQATALLEQVASPIREHVSLRGGHVKSVVGVRSSARLAGEVARFLRTHASPGGGSR